MSSAGACLVALAMASSASPSQAQSMPIPAAVVRDSADQLVGQANIGAAGFVTVVLEIDGALAQFEVLKNGPESQVVWFDDNNCFGNPHLGVANLQSLAIMVGTQFAVAGGDPGATNPVMADFNTYSSGTGAGTPTLTKSSWSMQLGCVDLEEGFTQDVVAGSPVTTNPFAGMSRSFKVVRSTSTIVVADP
jgi:hypothetical protein